MRSHAVNSIAGVPVKDKRGSHEPGECRWPSDGSLQSTHAPSSVGIRLEVFNSVVNRHVSELGHTPVACVDDFEQTLSIHLSLNLANYCSRPPQAACEQLICNARPGTANSESFVLNWRLLLIPLDGYELARAGISFEINRDIARRGPHVTCAILLSCSRCFQSSLGERRDDIRATIGLLVSPASEVQMRAWCMQKVPGVLARQWVLADR